MQEKKIATTQGKLGLFRIKELELLRPPIEEQTEIVRCVEALFHFAYRLEARHQAAHAQIENSFWPRSPKPFAASWCRKIPRTNRPASCWNAFVRMIAMFINMVCKVFRMKIQKSG
jgi:hypothetical protein